MKTLQKVTFAFLMMSAATGAKADFAGWQSWGKGKCVAPYQGRAAEVPQVPSAPQRPQAISAHWQGFVLDCDQHQTLPYQGEKSVFKRMPYYPASEAFVPVPLSGFDTNRF